MSTEIKLPEGAPEEVVTKALLREVDLAAFGASGVLALITLDNGLDHNRHKEIEQKITRLGHQVLENCFEEPVIYIGGICGNGLKLAKQLKVSLRLSR